MSSLIGGPFAVKGGTVSAQAAKFRDKNSVAVYTGSTRKSPLGVHP